MFNKKTWIFVMFMVPIILSLPSFVFADDIQKKWYEAQILGVIVGALAVIASTYIPHLLEKRQEKKNLKTGIKCEVKVITKVCEEDLAVFEDYAKRIREKGGPPEIIVPAAAKTRFIDCSLACLGSLETEFVEKVIQLLASLDSAYGGLDSLKNLVPKIKSEEGWTLKKFLDCMEETKGYFKKTVDLGNEIDKFK